MLRGILLASIVAFTGLANAQVQTLKVSGKQRIKGTEVVRLKQLANQQLSAQGENPSDYSLVAVEMKAKADNRNSYATLVVGQDREKQLIGKRGGLQWAISAPWTFDELSWDLSNAPGDSNERWRIRFDGDIKVRDIRITVAKTSTRVRIPFNGELFTQDSTIALKRELNAMGYDMRGAQLERVVLVAKSRRGRGNAYLVTGQNTTASQTIDTAPLGFAFQDEMPRSYNRLRFFPQGNTRGRWQIQMRGRIKVKAVIVTFN